jgi:hypothetical protein
MTNNSRGKKNSKKTDTFLSEIFQINIVSILKNYKN